MARAKNPNRKKAFEIYKSYHAKISNREIAKMLNENERNISYWKKEDEWKVNYNPNGGAPIGNQNALGNTGGAPKENQNSRKHGFFSKYLPKETLDVFKDIETMHPLDIIWTNIKLKYSAIIRAQKIMFVTDKDETIKELKKTKENHSDKGSNSEAEWEVQFAWDRQATFLNAQSRAMSELRSLIKQYEEMLHKDWDMATEEQKLRVQRLKIQIENPELQHRKEIAEKKLELERERLDHAKKIDEMKNW